MRVLRPILCTGLRYTYVQSDLVAPPAHNNIALFQEVRMRQGSKKIFHLEAWVIKVMSLYKVCCVPQFKYHGH